jgi:hypothetical protein
MISAVILALTHPARATALDNAARAIGRLDGVAMVSPVHAPDRLFVGIRERAEISRMATLACQAVRQAGIVGRFRIVLIDGAQVRTDGRLPGDWNVLAEAECPASFRPTPPPGSASGRTR